MKSGLLVADRLAADAMGVHHTSSRDLLVVDTPLLVRAQTNAAQTARTTH